MTDRELLELLLQKATSMESNMTTKQELAEVKNNISRIENKIDTIVIEQQKDIVAMLQRTATKESVDRLGAKLDVLAHHVIENATDIQLLKTAR